MYRIYSKHYLTCDKRVLQQFSGENYLSIWFLDKMKRYETNDSESVWSLPPTSTVRRWNLDRITVFASWIFENFGSALFFSLTYENMTVSLGRIRKYSLVPYLDRCPEEFHGTNGYYKVFQTISLIF